MLMHGGDYNDLLLRRGCLSFYGEIDLAVMLITKDDLYGEKLAFD